MGGGLKSIRRGFVILVLVSTVVLTTVMGAISVFSIVGKTDVDASAIMNLTCANEASKIDLLLEGVEDAVEVESTLIEQDVADPKVSNDEQWFSELERLYTNIAQGTNGAVSFFVRVNLDEGERGFYWHRSMSIDKFTKASSIDELLGSSAAAHAGWDEALLRDGHRLWIEPTVGADDADRTTTYVVPIIMNGTYRGFVGMGLDFQRVIDQVASIKFYESGYGFLTDADGNVMYHPSIPSGTNLSQDDEEVPAVDAAIAAGTTTEDVVVYRYHGSDKRMAFHLLRNDMRLVLSVSADELYGARNQLIAALVVVTLVAAVVCAVVTMQFARRVHKPLDDLAAASERAAEGEVDDARVTAPNVLEVQRLARAHNKIVDRLQEQMAYIDGLAYLDALTGLPNRNAYYRAARRIDEHIAAGEAQAFTIVMLDVNNLKVVNDEQGHDAGDELLRQAARQMNDAFGGHPVYRIGGDEFTVLIGEAVTDACHVAEGPVSIACGSATYRPGEDTCVADVLARADTAMYECKRRMKQGR